MEVDMIKKKASPAKKALTPRKKPARTTSPAVQEELLSMPKKKVILIDGASFFHRRSRKLLNLGSVRWHEFVKALKELGTGAPTDPIYTIPLGMPDYVMKSMTASGMKIEPIDPAGEMDDHFLITIIRGLDPKEVETLVLVTYDSSFVEATRGAKARGVNVWWVAADEQGHLGSEAKATIQSEFNFVDMRAGIADRIRNREWEVRQPEEKKVKIEFQAEIPARDQVTFMSMIQTVIDRYKIKVSVSS